MKMRVGADLGGTKPNLSRDMSLQLNPVAAGSVEIKMNEQPNRNEIMLTSDVLARYKISRSTLYFWSTPARMPACFSRPFPKPTIGGSPKRWRTAEVMKWEEEVNATLASDQEPSQGAQSTL
ncbi:helix-turn-helix transcriptional regulator [Pantoea dispersa]